MIQIGSDRERIQSWFMSTLTMEITTITQKWSHKTFIRKTMQDRNQEQQKTNCCKTLDYSIVTLKTLNLLLKYSS